MSQPTKLGFVTGHAFGRAALDVLVRRCAELDSVELKIVIGLSPDKGHSTVGYADVVDLAAAAGARHFYAEDGSLRAHLPPIAEAPLDFLFVIGWSRLVSTDVLQLFPGVPDRETIAKACIGMHPTLLPTGRGRAPIPWTVLKDLAFSGVTAFVLSEGPDEGALLGQVGLPMHRQMCSARLFDLYTRAHGMLMSTILDRISYGDLCGISQGGDPSTWPKRTPADSRIVDGMSLDDIDRMLRACTGPYPRAFFEAKDGRHHPVATAFPGLVAREADSVLLPTSRVVLKLDPSL